MTFYLNIRNADRYNKALDRLQEALDACKRLTDEYDAISTIAEGNLGQTFRIHNEEAINMVHAWEKIDRAEKAAYKAAEMFYGRSVSVSDLYSDVQDRTMCVETVGFDVED